MAGTLSQVASATSTSSSVTGPSTILAGDLLVLWDIAINSVSSAPATAVPSGFTAAINFTQALIRAIVSYKIATGVEASATLSGMSGTNGTYAQGKCLYVFRGNAPVTAVAVNDANSENTVGDPTAQVINASGGAAPLIVLGAYNGFNGAVDPRSFSTTKDGEINSDTKNYLAYKIYNSSPSDTTIDMDDEGNSNTLISCYLGVTITSAVSLTAAAGAYTLTGVAAALKTAWRFAAAAGAYALTGKEAVFVWVQGGLFSYVLSADRGVFTVSGVATAIVKRIISRRFRGDPRLHKNRAADPRLQE